MVSNDVSFDSQWYLTPTLGDLVEVEPNESLGLVPTLGNVIWSLLVFVCGGNGGGIHVSKHRPFRYSIPS